MKAIYYMTTTGQITSMAQCPDYMRDAQSQPGESWIMGDDTISDTTHYVDITQSPPVIAVSTANPAALDKASILSDNTDTATISGIPNPSTFQVTGPEWVNGEVLDGTLAFTTDEPGEYTITITSDHRYLDKEFTIDAN